MTADIVAFPMGERMKSVWLARASGRFVNKWEIDPQTEVYFQLMDAVEVSIEEDAEEWTKEEIDQFVDSFFDEFTIVYRPSND